MKGTILLLPTGASAVKFLANDEAHEAPSSTLQSSGMWAYFSAKQKQFKKPCCAAITEVTTDGTGGGTEFTLDPTDSSRKWTRTAALVLGRLLVDGVDADDAPGILTEKGACESDWLSSAPATSSSGATATRLPVYPLLHDRLKADLSLVQERWFTGDLSKLQNGVRASSFYDDKTKWNWVRNFEMKKSPWARKRLAHYVMADIKALRQHCVNPIEDGICRVVCSDSSWFIVGSERKERYGSLEMEDHAVNLNENEGG